MATAISSFVNVINPAWITGPIFDKELRVCSRRKRNYVIRSVYVLLLMLLVATTWYSSMYMASAGFRASRMGEVGRRVIMTITWFQFMVGQIAAILMLNSAISDEVRRKTLDVLLTTPINSFQIVMGKLFSAILQLMLLLGISLPLLAIVRVFGGMEWSYVASSFAVTLTAIIFTGSLTLLMSVRIHRPYIVIVTMLVLMVVMYFSTVFQMVGSMPLGTTVRNVLVHINPFAAFLHLTMLTFPGRPNVATFFSCRLHCAIMLVASLVVVCMSITGIRGAAFRKSSASRSKLLRPGASARRSSYIRNDRTGSIRPVEGAPIIWKELRKPFARTIVPNLIQFSILMLILILVLIHVGSRNVPFGIFYIQMLWLIASIRTATMAAVTIAREKQQRTWPILLGTSLTDREIIRGKAAAVLWRNLPMWLVIAVCPVFSYAFAQFFQNSPMLGHLGGTALQVAAKVFSVAANLLFFVGAGLYFGHRLRSTTAAVVATLASIIGFLFLQQTVFQIVTTMVMVRSGTWSFGYRSFLLFTSGILRTAVGLFLLARIKRGLRRHIF